MNRSKILIGLVLLLYALYVVFQFAGYESVAGIIRSFIFPSVALVYFLTATKKSLLFSLFLIFYSVSDLLCNFSDQLGYKVDYFLGNYLYILAYAMLLIQVCKSISLMHLLRNLKIHLLVLLVLNVYIVYVLQVIIDQRIAMGIGHEYIVEMLYNIVILLLLSASLLNYFYRDNKKSLYLFIGSLCIVFSEVISVAYLYVAKKELLDFFALTLALLAFYFYYQQSKLENTEHVNNAIIE